MGDGQVLNARGRTIIAVSAIFSAFAILTVILRFAVRARLRAGCYLDDWLAVAALVVTLGVTVNNIVGVVVAGIGDDEYYRTDADAPGFPYPRELRPQGQVMFALQILHTCAMPIIKACILTFYWRIFKEKRAFRIGVWCIAVYVFCWWISILFATIFQCNPISDNWGTEPSQLGGCLSDIPKMYETAALTNIFSDVAILVLPIPVIWNLQMLRKHKLVVLLIFLTGAVVVVAGIGRTVAYFSFRHLEDYNFSSDYYPLVIWTSLEPTLGVIGACLPTIRPLFHGFSPESIVNSIRSALSLGSRRRGSNGSGSSRGSNKSKAPTAGGSGGTKGRKRSGSTGGESAKGFRILGQGADGAPPPPLPTALSRPTGDQATDIELDEHPAFGSRVVDEDLESGHRNLGRPNSGILIQREYGVSGA